MGFWFGKKDASLPWRKTPAKIRGRWFTPRGEKVRSPRSYFATIEERGRFWKGKTGWKKK